MSRDRRKGRATTGGSDSASLSRPHPQEMGEPRAAQMGVLPAASGGRELCSSLVDSRELKMRGTHERLEASSCLPPQEAQSRDRVPGAVTAGVPQEGRPRRPCLTEEPLLLREECWGSRAQLSSHNRPRPAEAFHPALLLRPDPPPRDTQGCGAHPSTPFCLPLGPPPRQAPHPRTPGPVRGQPRAVPGRQVHS